jgi:hypothetical protein
MYDEIGAVMYDEIGAVKHTSAWGRGFDFLFPQGF